MSPAVHADTQRALALVVAFWGAPDGDKMADSAFAGLLDEALSDRDTRRATMVGLLLVCHELLDAAGDGDSMLSHAGLRLATAEPEG